MHTLSNFFSPVDCQEVSLCQARLLCYFDILNWSLYFWISLYHVASHNWEKSEFYLDLLHQFQGKLMTQLLGKGHLQHGGWVLGTVAPWPSLRLYMLMLVPIGTCPQSFCRGFVWHLSYWTTKDSGYQKLTKYGSCLCILCHLILLLQFKICTVLTNSKLGIWCTSPASTNQVNCAN